MKDNGIKFSNHITGRKATGWDLPGFDYDEEHGPNSKNSKGKRFGYVKSWRKKCARHFRQLSKKINLTEE